MSTKKHLIQVRSNTNMSVNYATFNLAPQVELILLTQEPVYKAKKEEDGSYIEKSMKLSEFRVVTSLDGINEMIADLQKVASDLQVFGQMAGSLNKVIEQYKKTEEKDEKK